MLHTPVLRDELVDAVTTDRDGAYVDATFGRGGHSIALLQRLNSGARLLAIDRDADAVAAARALALQDPRVTAAQGRFSELAEILFLDAARLIEAAWLESSGYERSIKNPSIAWHESAWLNVRESARRIRVTVFPPSRVRKPRERK